MKHPVVLLSLTPATIILCIRRNLRGMPCGVAPNRGQTPRHTRNNPACLWCMFQQYTRVTKSSETHPTVKEGASYRARAVTSTCRTELIADGCARAHPLTRIILPLLAPFLAFSTLPLKQKRPFPTQSLFFIFPTPARYNTIVV